MGQGISQATGQIKGLGTAMDKASSTVKQTSLGLGAAVSLVTTNLVNTANSVIGLKRQYEDLTREQNNVKQAGFSLANSQNMLKTATDKLTAAKKGKSGATQREIQEAQMQFKEDMKNAKSKLDVMKAQDKLNKVLHQGGIDTDKVAAAQRRVENLTRRVASATINQKEAQIDLKRATEDFYLQIIPTAIGVVGSFAGVLQVVQGAGGIGGLTSSFLKFSPVLLGIGAGFAALKTNFLGITTFFQNLGRDIGNAVPQLKPFLSLLESVFATIGIGDSSKAKGLNNLAKQFMDSFKPIGDFFKNTIDKIMKGDLSGIFNGLKTAALNAWSWIKTNVPLIGGIDKVVNLVRAGKWDEAFEMVTSAALRFWTDLKKRVPFLGGVELLINDIRNGKWADAFNIVKQAAVTALSGVFGKDWTEKVISQINALPKMIESNLNNPSNKGKNPFQGTGIIDKIIGLDTWSPQGFWDAFVKKLTTGGALSSSITKTVTTKTLDPDTKMLADKIGASLTGFARNTLDPFITSLFDPKTWTDSFKAQGKGLSASFTQISTLIYSQLFPKDKKGGIAGAGAAVNSMVDGLVSWFNTNFPQTSQKLSSISNGIIKAVRDFFTVKTLTTTASQLAGAIRGAVLAVSNKFLEIGKIVFGFIWEGLIKKVTSLPGDIGAAFNNAIGARNIRRAAGFHGFVSGATPMVVGERGIEKVDVTPMSDIVNRRNSGLSGRGTNIIHTHVYLDRRQIAEAVANTIGENQAVYR